MGMQASSWDRRILLASWKHPKAKKKRPELLLTSVLWRRFKSQQNAGGPRKHSLTLETPA
jgi:hypothetical protein